jgi:hypothetical protein
VPESALNALLTVRAGDCIAPSYSGRSNLIDHHLLRCVVVDLSPASNSARSLPEYTPPDRRWLFGDRHDPSTSPQKVHRPSEEVATDGVEDEIDGFDDLPKGTTLSMVGNTMKVPGTTVKKSSTTRQMNQSKWILHRDDPVVKGRTRWLASRTSWDLRMATGSRALTA